MPREIGLEDGMAVDSEIPPNLKHLGYFRAGSRLNPKRYPLIAAILLVAVLFVIVGLLQRQLFVLVFVCFAGIVPLTLKAALLQSGGTWINVDGSNRHFFAVDGSRFLALKPQGRPMQVDSAFDDIVCKGSFLDPNLGGVDFDLSGVRPYAKCGDRVVFQVAHVWKDSDRARLDKDPRTRGFEEVVYADPDLSADGVELLVERLALAAQNNHVLVGDYLRKQGVSFGESNP